MANDVPMVPLASSSISSAGYDLANSELHVTFKGGRTYRYAEVPKHVFDGLLQAKSAGRYVSSSVVGKFKLAKPRKD